MPLPTKLDKLEMLPSSRTTNREQTSILSPGAVDDGTITTEISYSGRVTPWGPEVHHRLAPDALCSSSARANNRIAYASIRKIRVHKIRYLGSRTTYWRCVLQSVDGERTCLQAAHYVGFRRVEDRSASYIPFIKQLEARIAAANPTVVFEQGSHWLAVGDAVLGWLAIAALGPARRVNVNVATVASAFLTCRLRSHSRDIELPAPISSRPTRRRFSRDRAHSARDVGQSRPRLCRIRSSRPPLGLRSREGRIWSDRSRSEEP